jgi:hypothetical protein
MTHRELSTRTIIRALMQIAALVEFKQKAISLSTLFAIRCYKNLLPGPYYKKISVLYKTILAHSFVRFSFLKIKSESLSFGRKGRQRTNRLFVVAKVVLKRAVLK